jgi:hypothetical protein
MANYRVAQMDEIEPVACPCGWARRAFTSDEDQSAIVPIPAFDPADEWFDEE